MENTHTKRMIAALALMVLALVTISISQLTNTGEAQEAAVLRAYAK